MKQFVSHWVYPYKKYDNNKYGLDIDSFERKLTEVSFFSNSFKTFLISIRIHNRKYTPQSHQTLRKKAKKE